LDKRTRIFSNDERSSKRKQEELDHRSVCLAALKADDPGAVEE